MTEPGKVYMVECTSLRNALLTGAAVDATAVESSSNVALVRVVHGKWRVTPFVWGRSPSSPQRPQNLMNV